MQKGGVKLNHRGTETRSNLGRLFGMTAKAGGSLPSSRYDILPRVSGMKAKHALIQKGGVQLNHRGTEARRNLAPLRLEF